MKATFKANVEKDIKYLIVDARVRYWEDTTVNGVEDEDGSLIPFRNGDSWSPVIDIEGGTIVDWPKGTTAEIHYKVCDNGDYFLADQNKRKVATRTDDYVPGDFLCHGDQGYGDYIILKVDGDGSIQEYTAPLFEAGDWALLVD